jgi:hypothetical protein
MALKRRLYLCLENKDFTPQNDDVLIRKKKTMYLVQINLSVQPYKLLIWVTYVDPRGRRGE